MTSGCYLLLLTYTYTYLLILTYTYLLITLKLMQVYSRHPCEKTSDGWKGFLVKSR